MKLNGSPVDIGKLLGALTQLMKQLITQHLEENGPECVKAVISFNDQSSLLEADLRCSFIWDETGEASAVAFKNLKPDQQYTSRKKPTKAQMKSGVLGSVKRRSGGNLMLKVQQTTPKF